jgi:hypothetical protein
MTPFTNWKALAGNCQVLPKETPTNLFAQARPGRQRLLNLCWLCDPIVTMFACEVVSMLIRGLRRSLIVGVLVGSLAPAGGCGGDESGTQVKVDKEKDAALLKSMGGYSGYAKKGKSKGAAAPETAPASATAPTPASTP